MSKVSSNTAIKGVKRVIVSNTQLNSVALSVAEDTIFTGTIPANSIGPNGSFHIIVLMGCNNTANNKTFRVRFNGTLVSQLITLNSTAIRGYWTLVNRNSLTSQVSLLSTSNSAGTFISGTTGGLTTYSIDTGAAITVTLSLQDSVGTDNSSLEAFEILAFY